MFLVKFYAWYLMSKYKLKHWVFQWKQDNEGDIALVVFGCLVFLKYKEHTIFRIGAKDMKNAPKYVRG